MVMYMLLLLVGMAGADDGGSGGVGVTDACWWEICCC